MLVGFECLLFFCAIFCVSCLAFCSSVCGVSYSLFVVPIRMITLSSDIMFLFIGVYLGETTNPFSWTNFESGSADVDETFRS